MSFCILVIIHTCLLIILYPGELRIQVYQNPEFGIDGVLAAAPQLKIETAEFYHTLGRRLPPLSEA